MGDLFRVLLGFAGLVGIGAVALWFFWGLHRMFPQPWLDRPSRLVAVLSIAAFIGASHLLYKGAEASGVEVIPDGSGDGMALPERADP